MRQVTILRTSTSDQGTFGYMVYPGGWLYTIELPWRQNIRSISCVPQGDYEAKIRKSPKYGKVYILLRVPRRSYILIHSMNVAGDTSKGYKTESEGCIGLGKKKGILWGQKAVLVSRLAVRQFMQALAGEPFKLTIREAYVNT